MLELVVAVDEVVVVVLAEVVVVDEDVEVELEDASAIPASAQLIELVAKLKGKFVGEETPLVEYSAYPPKSPPPVAEESVKPEPAVVETKLVVPTMPTRKAPL